MLNLNLTVDIAKVGGELPPALTRTRACAFLGEASQHAEGFGFMLESGIDVDLRVEGLNHRATSYQQHSVSCTLIKVAKKNH